MTCSLDADEENNVLFVLSSTSENGKRMGNDDRSLRKCVHVCATVELVQSDGVVIVSTRRSS